MIELFLKFKEMRTAQINYFMEKNPRLKGEHLIQSKKLELEVDKLIASFMVTGGKLMKVEQKELF